MCMSHRLEVIATPIFYITCNKAKISTPKISNGFPPWVAGKAATKNENFRPNSFEMFVNGHSVNARTHKREVIKPAKQSWGGA